MTKHSIKSFNPAATAQLDARMWQAYYSHNFMQLILLLVRLMHTQFGFSWAQSVRAAYYSGRAAAVFRKHSTAESYDRPLKDLEVFFAYVDKHAVESFDSTQVAERELHWWLVHRRPKQYPESLEDALSAAMASLYQLPARKFSNYANYRAKAMHLRDTAIWEAKAEPDWHEIEELLRQAYSSLKLAIQ